MWIFTGFGYYSVIQHRDDPELLLVRARVKGDLEKLKQYLPNLGEIVATPSGADYPYRALAWRSEFAEAMKKTVLESLNYTNFKSGISRTQGSPRHDLYMRVWSIMKDAEPTLRRLEKEEEERAKNPDKFYTHSSGSSWVSSHTGLTPVEVHDERLVVRNGNNYPGGRYQEWLNLRDSRKAREDRLRDNGQSSDMRRAEIEASAERHRELRIRGLTKQEKAARKRVESLVAGQLKGGPNDFDREFEDEIEEAPPSNWVDSAEKFAQGMSDEDEVDPTIDREKK